MRLIYNYTMSRQC